MLQVGILWLGSLCDAVKSIKFLPLLQGDVVGSLFLEVDANAICLAFVDVVIRQLYHKGT